MSENSDNKRSTKEDYDKHISFLKWAMATVSIAITVGTWFTWSSMDSYKKDIKDDMSEIKKDVKELKIESIATLKETKSDFSSQIPIIKESAEDLAFRTVNKLIAEQFESKNLQELIERTAETKLQNKIDKVIKTKVEEVTQSLDTIFKGIVDISLAIDQTRSVNRLGIEILDSLRYKSTNPYLKKAADKAYERKVLDYEIDMDCPLNIDSLTFYVEYLDSIKLGEKQFVKYMLSIINHAPNLYDVIDATCALRQAFNINFPLFDLTYVNRWYKEQYLKNSDYFNKILNSKIILPGQKVVPMTSADMLQFLLKSGYIKSSK